MPDLPAVFNEDITALVSGLQTKLESALGRALAPADVEMLIANTFAYELQLYNVAGNQAFRQNMVHFASNASLDFLGELVGVNRLPASGAGCTVRFNFVAGHNAVQLPAGLRVQSIDGQAVFQTGISVDIAIGVDYVDVPVLCQTAGVVGNNYGPGKIAVILDPQPFVTTVANIDTTSGGVDAETDDQLRERIALAPSSFSVAGPKGAYIYFAKSAHPSIVDVACITTNPGEVTLYPLCADGTLPSPEILAAVLSICSDTKVRPQNDTVLAAAPDINEYTIEVEVTTYTGAVTEDVQAQVLANLQAFQSERENELGLDVIRTQLIGRCIIPGQVYTVNVLQPAADIVADEKTYPKCTGITVTVTGSNNG